LAIGAAISVIFGGVWTNWGASGFTGAAAAGTRTAGVVLALVILFWTVRLWRSAPRASGADSPGAPPGQGSRSRFSLSSYLVVVALEVVACGGGGRLLSATGHREYIIVWVATVVGMHFLAFGRLFWAGFYWLGTALIVAGAAGAMVGFAGGGADAIRVTCGLIAAASMFVAAGWSLLGAQASASV